MRPRLYFSGWPSFLLIPFLSFQLLAQEPYRVPFACDEEDLQAAGMSCSEDDPCPIYLEINSIAPNGRKLFLAGNLHSTSATLSSILLMSEDSGAGWKEPSPRVRGSALDQLQFYTLQDGWAAGEAQYPLARDPFFLMTNDGGSSWRQVAVGEEGTAGAIQRFWFDSTQHGELIVDAGKASTAGRYLSYESETGGSNWTLRGKSDQLPKLRSAPASMENLDWRVRPSRDGKSYSVEQRDGTKWTSLSTLAIEVAKCTGKADELKEPESFQPPPPIPASPTANTPKKPSKK
jgi:photosystem II stability/assembly factor-like uncharacterized protein